LIDIWIAGLMRDRRCKRGIDLVGKRA